METYCEIILDLENELSKMKRVSEKISEQMEFAIGHCKVALDHMRELVVCKDFLTKNRKSTFLKRSNRQTTVVYYTIGLSLIWKVNVKKPTHLLSGGAFKKGFTKSTSTRKNAK